VNPSLSTPVLPRLAADGRHIVYAAKVSCRSKPNRIAMHGIQFSGVRAMMWG
jgi:hypothetical protein